MPNNNSSLSGTNLESLDQLNAQIIVSHEPFSLSELSHFPMSPYSDLWEARLHNGGRELWLDAVEDAWFFLWIVDAVEGQGLCRVSIPVVERIWRSYQVGLHQNTLWLITDKEDVIEISTTEWKIRSWRSFRCFVPEDALVERAYVLPGSLHLWLETSMPGDTYIIHLETWSLERSLVDVGEFPMPVVGAPQLFHAFAEVRHDNNFYSVDGSRIPGSELPIDYKTESVTYAPSGEGFISLELLEDEEDPDEFNDMILHHLVPEADAGAFKIASSLSRRVLNDAPHRDTYQLVTSRQAGLAFVVVHLPRKHGDKALLALSLSKNGFRVHYRVMVPYDTVLVQDPLAQRVIAVFTDGKAMRMVPLGRKRPTAVEAFCDKTQDRLLWVPKIEVKIDDYCARPNDENDETPIYALSRELASMNPEDRRTVLGHYKAGSHDDARELVTLYHVLASMHLPYDEEAREEVKRERKAVLEILRREYAEHPSAALTVAQGEACAGHWRKVDRLLDVAEEGELGDRRRQHLLHLRALVHLHQGRGDEAFAELIRAHKILPWCLCPLNSLIELSEPMANPPEPDEWSPERSMLRQLLGAIRTTNRAFEAGDLVAVLTVLDKPAYWQQLEVETSARRAAVFLEIPASSAAERLHKRFVLARFCAARVTGFGRDRRIRLPHITWDDERMEQIEKASRDWLEGVKLNQIG